MPDGTGHARQVATGHGHAHVLRLDDDDHTAGFRDPHQRVRHLGGEPLLHLRTPGVDIHQAGQLGRPGDLAVRGGDVTDVGDSLEGEQVVFAAGDQVDVLEQHHLVVAQAGHGGQVGLGFLPETGEYLLVGTGDTGRGVAQPLPVRILADGDQELVYGVLGSLAVELVDGPLGFSMVTGWVMGVPGSVEASWTGMRKRVGSSRPLRVR